MIKKGEEAEVRMKKSEKAVCEEDEAEMERIIQEQIEETKKDPKKQEKDRKKR